MGVCFGNIIMGECFGNILITLSWKEKKGGVLAVPGRWVLDWAKAEICKSTFQSNFEFLVDSVEPGGGRQPRPEWWLQSPPAPSSLRSTFGKIFWKCFRIIVSWKKTLNISCQTSPSGRNPSEGWVKSGDWTNKIDIVFQVAPAPGRNWENTQQLEEEARANQRRCPYFHICCL